MPSGMIFPVLRQDLLDGDLRPARGVGLLKRFQLPKPGGPVGPPRGRNRPSQSRLHLAPHADQHILSPARPFHQLREPRFALPQRCYHVTIVVSSLPRVNCSDRTVGGRPWCPSAIGWNQPKTLPNPRPPP